MSTINLSVEHHVCVANLFVSSFQSNNHWLFIGDYTIHANTDVANVEDSVDQTFHNPWNHMILGKKITSQNVHLAIRNIPYYANKAYAMYDDEDPLLFNKDFYVVVNAASFFHVFKVLDNNNGANSVIQPDFNQITGANVVSYETSDGYRWKYMYTIDDLTKRNFGTVEYLPVIANTFISTEATKGSINVIKIIEAGKLYNNYLSGSFVASDIKVFGDGQLYSISSANAATSNGYYTGCIVYLTAGSGQGQYKRIIDYVSNTAGNFFRIESTWDISPQNGTYYEIYPECVVTGNGDQTINCVARAIVNSVGSNSIATIEILNPGKNYTVSSAFVAANNIVGVSTPASVRPILSPKGGHGYDVYTELNARNVIVSANLQNTESNTIMTTNRFQQIGILKNPIFNTANLTLTSPSAYFTSTEDVYIINPVTAAVNCSANVGNTTITGNVLTDFQNQFREGDFVYLTDDASNNQIAVVTAVTNSTSLEIDVECLFTMSDMMLKYPRITTNMICDTITSDTEISVLNVRGTFESGNRIIGRVSGATALVDTISRNNINKNFNTFIQLHKYAITMVSGTFTESEMVSQEDKTAILHSSNSSVMYLSYLSGPFLAGTKQVIGDDSGAVALINTIFPLELVYGKGEIIYIENIENVLRQPSQTEAVKLVFNF